MSETVRAGLQLSPQLSGSEVLDMLDELRKRGVKRFCWAGLDVEFYQGPPPGAVPAIDPYEPHDQEAEDREAMFAGSGFVPINLREMRDGAKS